MAGHVEDIVDRTIKYTRAALRTSRSDWGVARKGLEKIHADLARRAPGDRALGRLKAFIASEDRARRGS